MSLASMKRQLDKLEGLVHERSKQEHEIIDVIRHDPTQLMVKASYPPDPWQQQVLRSQSDRMLLMNSRQAGKSTVAAALALKVALLQPNAPVLLLSPTIRQSGELFRKIQDLFTALDRPMGVRSESALRLELANGSRIISLPGTEGTVRGFSGVGLLIIDEAARVADSLYYSVRPMLAVSRGRLVALSTPFGHRGWFYQEWESAETWERVRITADQCPRISKEFLEQERRALGERWYRQEYFCSFESTIDAVFNYEDIQRALSDDVEPLFKLGGSP